MFNAKPLTHNEADAATSMVISLLNQLQFCAGHDAMQQIVAHMEKTRMLHIGIARNALVTATQQAQTPTKAEIRDVADDMIRGLCDETIDVMMDEAIKMTIRMKIEEISFK